MFSNALGIPNALLSHIVETVSELKGEFVNFLYNWTEPASCYLFVSAALLQPPIFRFEENIFTSSFHSSSNVPLNMPGFCWDLKQRFACSLK